MEKGLSDKEAKQFAKAIPEALSAGSNTSEKVRKSAARILENSGSTVLGIKVANTDPETWSNIWGSIKVFFQGVWNGLSGAFDTLIEKITDLF